MKMNVYEYDFLRKAAVAYSDFVISLSSDSQICVLSCHPRFVNEIYS